MTSLANPKTPLRQSEFDSEARVQSIAAYIVRVVASERRRHGRIVPPSYSSEAALNSSLATKPLYQTPALSSHDSAAFQLCKAAQCPLAGAARPHRTHKLGSVRDAAARGVSEGLSTPTSRISKFKSRTRAPACRSRAPNGSEATGWRAWTQVRASRGLWAACKR
eukprot:scaffold385_cov305-Pinguiococcus_pyrenoidosus.AAC.5